MIAKMSKIELAGPKDLLEGVLSLLRDEGMLEIDPGGMGVTEKKDQMYIDSFLLSRESLSEKLFLEDMKEQIDELLSCLPPIPPTNGYGQARGLMAAVKETLKKHLPVCRELFKKKEELQKEQEELSRYTSFLDAVEPLLEEIRETPDVDFIGLSFRAPEGEEILRKALFQLTGDKFELLTSTADDGTTVGLIAVHKKTSDQIKRLLKERHMPELTFPSSVGDLPLVDKVRLLHARANRISDELELITMQLDSFSQKWGSIYKSIKGWIEERLSLFRATSSVFASQMCFFIYGWTASENVEKLKDRLNKAFKGTVVLEQLEIHEEDLDKVPVILKNPSYFRPFELFTRILPLPRYTSYDPTPFIGIFFPLFFGMILGDAGYGSILIIISLFILYKYAHNRAAADAARILGVASFYSIVFGVLYGEFFGEAGALLFGLKPLLIERRTMVLPMLYFAVSVGIVHILLGFILGFITALKKRTTKEALLKLFEILIILCLLSLVASLFGFFPVLMRRPLILAIVIIIPILFFTGGLLAPLEVVKSIGNIISYARIMAIGLTSVLLAYVANRLAGMTGDIVIGAAVAGILHLLNIIIGVFSPTIHSLRLHYVEFFNKFIESGGRQFEPLRKEDNIS